jgi:four helix bundle protein
MDSYRDLVAWQRAMVLVTNVYKMVESFPAWERYGQTIQVCKAACSVPNNIAEGKGRLSKREYILFLGRARGSLLEVETQLEIARNVGYLAPTQFDELFEQAAQVGRALNGLIKSIQRQLPTAKSPQPRARNQWTTANS